MVLFQRILLLAVVATIATGFYFKTDEPSFGDLLIGCGLVVGFFVLMPLFIYSRYNGRDLSRYMLSEENIKRMRRYQHGDEEE
jgi:hypothetical protein